MICECKTTCELCKEWARETVEEAVKLFPGQRLEQEGWVEDMACESELAILRPTDAADPEEALRRAGFQALDDYWSTPP